MRIIILVSVVSILLFFLATGCTARFTGEVSIMKQWDRPGEYYKTETKPEAK